MAFEELSAEEDEKTIMELTERVRRAPSAGGPCVREPDINYTKKKKASSSYDTKKREK
jgi:hypothetical protein